MLTKAKIKSLRKAWCENMADAEIGPLLEHIAEQDTKIAALCAQLAEADKKYMTLAGKFFSLGESRVAGETSLNRAFVNVVAMQATADAECERLRGEIRWAIKDLSAMSYAMVRDRLRAIL